MALTGYTNDGYFTSTAITATTSAFNLLGGDYMLAGHSSNWNSATVALSINLPGTATFLPVSTLTADSTASLKLPAGSYKLVVTGTLTGAATVMVARVTTY